ncbi:MAG: M48 family metallopeptidase [Candidatus Krumholzibacteriia bacterium]
MPRSPEKSELTLIAGRPARYRVRRSDRARRLTLRITHDDGLVVVLPRRMGRAEVARALREHETWLDRQLELYGVRQGPVRREVATGREIPVLGEPRRLVVAPLDDGRVRARIDLLGGVLEARLPAARLLDPRPDLERWLRALAREVITGRVLLLWPRVGVTPRRIVIGERVTRWGSCSHDGTLSFCYRLVMAPVGVIDAIVLHELCHLVHFDHSRRFHALLREVCPDYAEQRAWLRAHAGELTL